MITESLTVELTFTEPLLAVCPGNRDIYHDWKSPNAPSAALAAEEEAALPELDPEEIEIKGMTVFPRDDTGLHFWDWQLRGMIKEQIETLVHLGSAPDALNVYNYKKAVNKFVHVTPRRVYLLDPSGNPWKIAIEKLQRPLRASTMRGERIALASSELLPVGTTCRFDVILLQSPPKSGPKTKLAVFDEDLIAQCLNLGKLTGLGQWRSGGWGRFTWERLKAEG